MILDADTVSIAEFEARTGWTSRPEGFCKGDVCVPAPEAIVDGDRLDAGVLSAKLGMPLVVHEPSGTSALGPESLGHSLTTAELPEIELPDVHGESVALSSLRGRKVLLVAWASW